MRLTRIEKVLRVLLVTGLAAGATAVLAFQGPRLSATYEASSVSAGSAGVSVTFAFTLHNRGDAEIVVDRIALADLSDAESAYATFGGGTIGSGGELSGSRMATVPGAAFERWQSGGPAVLYVYSRTERGDVFRTRVDAYRAPGTH
ncbi:MAG: hypothetical protein LAO51_00085 [Acidobacteriia bacterium]|nr:hypothetical protein [Terriglobia bacterium]